MPQVDHQGVPAEESQDVRHDRDPAQQHRHQHRHRQHEQLHHRVDQQAQVDEADGLRERQRPGEGHLAHRVPPGPHRRGGEAGGVEDRRAAEVAQGGGGLREVADVVAEVRTQQERRQVQHRLADHVLIRVQRQDEQRRETGEDARPPGQFPGGPQHDVEQHEGVEEPVHVPALDDVAEVGAQPGHLLAVEQLPLPELEPQLDGHPHEVGHEEEPQAAEEELPECETEHLRREEAADHEEQGHTEGVEDAVDVRRDGLHALRHGQADVQQDDTDDGQALGHIGPAQAGFRGSDDGC